MIEWLTQPTPPWFWIILYIEVVILLIVFLHTAFEMQNRDD
jgi:hypothetical protein